MALIGTSLASYALCSSSTHIAVNSFRFLHITFIFLHSLTIYSTAADRIPKSLDAEMDKSMNGKEMAPVGVSIRNGPVAEDKMDVDSYTNGKRKARTSTASKVSYNEDHSSDDSDVKPVVCEVRCCQGDISLT